MPNWNEVLAEIQGTQSAATQAAAQAMDTVRRKYLRSLAKHTERNVIAYYSGFLQKPGILQTQISDEDKNGIMTCVHNLDRARGLDLIIHTEGGNIAATQSLVHYLQQMFGKDIRAIVPQIAMSAGTIIACCSKSILMGKQSNLGPIDPHIAGIPTKGVIQEFDKALKEIKKDAAKIHVWQPILRQYRPTFLGQCENALKWSNSFVKQQLSDNMFFGVRGKKGKIAKIIRALTNYQKGHAHHLHMDDCIDMGLNIEKLEDDAVLQDLVLTCHHSFMHAFANTTAMKIIENHNGAAFVKHHRK